MIHRGGQKGFPMFSFYPQAGVRFNPMFTERDFALFARDVEEHAFQTYQMAFAAFARAADSSQGPVLIRLNLDHLVQAGHSLLLLYRIASEDRRINELKVGRQVNLLYWAIIGRTEQLLRFQDGDDYLKNWHHALARGGLFARLAAELALAGAASGTELGEMIASLSRLSAWTAGVREYHLEMVRDVPEDVDDLVGLASEAGELTMTLSHAAARMHARAVLEQTAALLP